MAAPMGLFSNVQIVNFDRDTFRLGFFLQIKDGQAPIVQGVIVITPLQAVKLRKALKEGVDLYETKYGLIVEHRIVRPAMGQN